MLGFQNLRQVVARIGIRRRHQRINIRPILRPHISQQMRGNRAVRAEHARPIFFHQLRAHVGVQRNVQRAHLFPQPVHLRAENAGRHIVIRAPHRAHVGEAHFARAFVRQLHHARVALAHRRRDGVPADPCALQLDRIAAGGHNIFQVVQREAFPLRAIRAPFPLAVVALQRRIDLRKLRAFFGIARRGDVHGKLDELQLARYVRRQIERLEAPRLCG